VADRYHLAGTTDFGAGASYHDGIYGASGAPADTDTLYYSEGQDTMSAGLDQTGIDLTAMYETPGYGGRVGTSGSSLKIELNQGIGTFDKGGHGIWFVQWITTGGGAGTCKIANLRSGATTISAGTTSAVNVYGGEHTFTDGAVLHQLPVIVKGGVVTIDFRASDTPDVTVHSGTVYLYRAVRTLIIKGGRVVSQVMKAAVAATTVTVEGDGYYDHRAGTITTLNANDGTVDFSKMVKNVTLTNSTFNGARAISRTGANGLTITYTNPATIGSPPDGGSDGG
jgi:hypothetical protein